MITNDDLNNLYQWGKINEFPFKSVPSAKEYANKPINYCWLKAGGDSPKTGSYVFHFNKRAVKCNLEIEKILSNDDIIFASVVLFDPDTYIQNHIDPNVYHGIEYKRVQIPLIIPDKNCYMVWKGKKIYWEEGVCQCFDVMYHYHEGGNLSDKPMKFLMLDVKISADVESISNIQ
jgi:hypothetical protein